MSDTPNAAPGAEVRYFPSGLNRGNLTVGELIDGYLVGYDGRDSSRSQRLAFWRTELGQVRLHDLDSDMIAESLLKLKRTEKRRFVGRDADGKPVTAPAGRRSPATINRFRMALSAVLTWARHERLTPKGAWVNPCRDVRSETENNLRTRFLSPDERERLLKACRVSSWPKLYLYVLLLLVTGCRRSEGLGLKYADLDLDAKTATLHTSKNKRPRVMPLTDALIAELRRQGLGKPEALVFASPRDPKRAYAINAVWAKAVRRAGLENFRLHDCRHSTASYLAQNGAGLLEISEVLGHTTLKMAARYAHLTVGHKAALINRVLGDIGKVA